MRDNKAPDTAGGPFYIDQVECVVCGTCQAVAPDLIGTEPGPNAYDLYLFRRQPELPGELNRAIAAVEGCCVAAIYYRGSDPEILKRISSFSIGGPNTCCGHGPDTDLPILSTPPAGFWTRLRAYFNKAQ